jgi:hypothetical protein
MKYVKYLDDVLVLFGCALILVFIYKIAPIYTWLVGGLMCLGLSVLVGMANRSSK